MESNASFFSLPVSIVFTEHTQRAKSNELSVDFYYNNCLFPFQFIDNADVDFSKIKGGECDYNDLLPTLPSHGSILGADDVLAQFLSGDELLEEPDLNGPTTLHCEICKKQFDNAKKYYGHLRVHSKENLWICGEYNLEHT